MDEYAKYEYDEGYKSGCAQAGRDLESAYYNIERAIAQLAKQPYAADQEDHVDSVIAQLDAFLDSVDYQRKTPVSK